MIAPGTFVQSLLKVPSELKVAAQIELPLPLTTISILLLTGFHARAGGEMMAPGICVQTAVKLNVAITFFAAFMLVIVHVAADVVPPVESQLPDQESRSLCLQLQ